jgi:1,2-phenylacetyl-CoA epoxidase catalytic subunit
LIQAGIMTRSLAEAEAAWRADLTAILVPLGLALPPETTPSGDGRTEHSDAFRWLWGEFTAVRRLDPEAVW